MKWCATRPSGWWPCPSTTTRFTLNCTKWWTGSWPTWKGSKVKMPFILRFFTKWIDTFPFDITESPPIVQPRVVDSPTTPGKVDMADFECTLCCRLMWQPVTTPCGHSFCRTCLDRCMDHTPACPLCKTSLEEVPSARPHYIIAYITRALCNVFVCSLVPGRA